MTGPTSSVFMDQEKPDDKNEAAKKNLQKEPFFLASEIMLLSNPGAHDSRRFISTAIKKVKFIVFSQKICRIAFYDKLGKDKKDVQTVSMSGMGISAHAGARFEFWKHFFIQLNGAAGFLNQMNVDTRPNDYTSNANQKLGYSSAEIVAGGLFYFKPKKGCDSCPQWGK